MERRRVILLCDDEDLTDEVVRVAAAAGCELERVPDAVALRRRWPGAAMVLLDERGAAAVASAVRPARRDGVVVLCLGDPPGSVWEPAVAVGAEHVVSLPEGEDWLVTALADVEDLPDDGPGRVVCVLGGRGGAGASVLAGAIAVRARDDGARVLLVDCDPLGGGLDLVVGAEQIDGLRWPGLALGGGRVAASSLHDALPHADGPLTVLACDRHGPGPAPEAAVAVVEAGRRAGDVVVCDLPRHLTPTATAVLEVADLTVLVVPAEVRATAAASRVAQQVTELGATVGVVVRGPSPGGLGGEDVAAALGLEVLASVDAEPGLAAAMDHGTVPGVRRGPLADAACAVLDALDGRRGGPSLAA
ncbi:septum site-determining protein Ssd [Actinomycetospora termitidis]|uniref:CpaE-like family protein n=1 Tax=Actinomycetospora termitidis TaxID=3053470 RepID=A0ABT7M1H2_9PSEU|nr:septum site-determining protein Ssd [Actinomycetospora sp. Odt1-22]MDL5154495.1 CpaE-like family protein [Actinomycetospora sp. Odt1-22]